MKKLLFFTITMLFMSSAAFAQTQKGYVKTKGRLDNDGNLIPGTPLSEVVVKVKDRNEVMSDKRGDFSFPMPDQTYYLESVAKNGYVLIDPDVLSKQYSYSKNKLVIALETKDQQIEERMDNFRKINEAQNAMITKLRAEVKQLKEENKITEEEYYKRLQEIVDMQNESQKLVEEMVERYSKMDFDQLSEFELQIKSYILSGDLLKAKSMIMSKGDLTERAADLRRHQEANAKERDEIEKRSKKLEKSEALAQKKLEELAKDYYDLFEIYKLEHKNDSAAYYLELRAALDTTNVEWLLDASDFVREYMADYKKAFNYSNNALDIAIKKYGEHSKEVAVCYNRVGNVYLLIGNYEESTENHEKALTILHDLFGSIHTEIGYSYNNLAYIQMYKGDNYKALELFQQALEIWKACYGENNIDVANCINNIGDVYQHLDKYDESYECYKKSLDIHTNLLGPESPDIINTYINIGTLFAIIGEYDKSLMYIEQALEIANNILNEKHPLTATIYNNMGFVYHYKGDIDSGLEYTGKALHISEDILGKKHKDVAVIYSNIGSIYIDKDDYDKALEYFGEAEKILIALFGEMHPDIAIIYDNIGGVYYNKGEFDKALEYDLKALEIRKSIYSDSNADVASSYNNIGAIMISLNNYDEALNYIEKALEIRLLLYGEMHMQVSTCYNNLGGVYKMKGDYEKALENYTKALIIRGTILGDNHIVTVKTRNEYEMVKDLIKNKKNK